MRTVMQLDRMLQTMFKSKAKLAVMALALASGAAMVAGAQVPSVVFNQTNGLCGVGSGGCSDFSATGSKLGVNSRGDVFIPATNSTSQFIEEIPANGGAPVIVFNGLQGNSGGRAVYVDSGNNLWYGYDDSVNYSVDVIYVPFRNGAYAPNVSYSSLSGTAGQCPFPVPQTQMTTCRVQLNYGGAVGYYVQAADLAMDGAGDLYLLIKYEGPCYPGPTCYNEILKFDTSNNESAIDATLPNNTGSPEFAVSNSGEIFYEDGSGNNYYYAAGATYPGTGSRESMSFYYIVGMARDAGGNVYLTQNNNGGSIIELPFVHGSACQTSPMSTSYCGADQYVLSYALGGYTNAPSNGVGVTSYGKIFYLGSYPNSINTMTVGGQNFGNATLGQSSGTQTVQLTFGNNNAYKTFGNFNVTGPFSVTGTTCANGTTYGPYATNSCTVTLEYTPTAAGPQTGSVQALDNGGNLIGQAELSGTGVAAAIDVDPGTVSNVGATLASPQAIAVDAAGNTYVADKKTGNIYKSAAGATTSTAVATGFASPAAVAVDGAGDVFVADSTTNSVVEIAYVNGSYSTTQQTLVTGLKGASGLTTDDLGNVYVADSGNGRVLLLSSSGNQALGTITTTLTGTYTTPVAVAVDGAQNVYVSDTGTKKVTSFNVPNGLQGTVVSGLTTAAGVATDPGGGLFVVDSGAKSIVHIPSIGGTLTPNLAVTLGTIVTAPNAVAADSAGNVYAVDSTDNTVGKMTRTTGLLSFGNVEEMTSTAATAATVSNEGTASATFRSPYYSATGSTADFVVQSSSTCANSGTLGTGAACSVAAVFMPQGASTYTDTLEFASTPTTATTLVLTGVGVNLPRTTTTITSITPTAPTYGQPITIVATVALVVPGIPTPTGTVTFAIDGVNQVPSPLNGTTATLVIPALGGGTHSISATYNGSATYAGSATTTASSVTVAKAATTDTLVISVPYSNLTSQNPGANVLFTATIAPQLAAVPTGMVTFSSGGVTLATVPVVGGVGTLNTTTLTPGNYSVVATYSGDGNYAGSVSTPAQPLIISNPTTITTTSSSTIVGGGGPVTLTLYSISGYANTADLSCTGLPAYAVCSFNPPYVQITPDIPATVQLSVLINQPPVIAVPGAFGALPKMRGFGRYGLLVLLLFLLPVVVGCVRLQRASRGMPSRMLSVAFLLLMLGGCTAVFSGCGGTSTQSYTTPKGTSTINVLVTLSTQPHPTPNPPAAQTIPFTLIVN